MFIKSTLITLATLITFFASTANAGEFCRATMYTERGSHITSVSKRSSHSRHKACAKAYRACLEIRENRLMNLSYSFDRYYNADCEVTSWSIPHDYRLVRRKRSHWHSHRGSGFRPATDSRRGTRVRSGHDTRRGRRRGSRR